MPEKSIERNNGSYPPDPAWDHRYCSCLLPFRRNPGLSGAAASERKPSQPRELDKSVRPLRSTATSIPHSLFLSSFVSYSHWEQSLAYKRRIPQADSRLNPHRARCKLKGHSLVFTRLCVCVWVCVKMLKSVTLSLSRATLDEWRILSHR